MSTSYGNRVSLARHNYPQSPFNRAREPNYEFDLDTSNFPTPSKQNGTRSRHSYRTSTLAGAYRAASRASLEENLQMGLSPSPRQARAPIGALSPNSERSISRTQPMDMYGRMEEAEELTNHVSLNGWGSPRGSRTASRTSRSSKEREYEEVANHGLAISEASLFSDTDRYSPRRRTTDYTKDEQRLRHVTGKDSPVFSRAKVGARAALTADNLSRREEEQVEVEVENQHISEDENDRGPSLNLPTTWGSRAPRREWLRNVSQRSVSDESKGNPEEQQKKSEPLFQHTAPNDTSAKLHLSPSLERDRPRIPTRNALQERTINPHVQEAPEPTEKTSKRKFDYDQNSPDANPIPNTPIVVFKNTGFAKPNYPKRDSQDLLRRLSRAESPKMDQVQTPEPPKLFGSRIYDKTPRVTGAWIDTPMTEKVAHIPSDLTKDIVAPPAPPVVPKETTPPVQESKPPAKVQTVSEDPKPQAPKESSKANGIKEPVVAKAVPAKDSEPAKPSRAGVIRPNLPKSGLEAVMENDNLGDDTVEDLRAIMEDPMDLETEEEEAAYKQEIMERLGLAESRSDDGERGVDLSRLNEKLASLANNVNQVKKGLDNLETKVSRQRTIVSQPGTSTKRSTQVTCEHGASHSDGRVYAAIPLPRLWTQNSSTGRGQPTKLGWVILVSLTWYVTECLMGEQFSHPIISDTCDGYCLQPDAPEFPFVTVTMLWRWSHLSTLLMPIFTVFMALARLLAQSLGLWDGYVDEPTSLGSLIGEIRINGTPVAFPWLSSTATPQVLTPPQQTVQPPIWTPREEPPRQHQAPVRWDDDQPSMDEDEYI